LAALIQRGWGKLFQTARFHPQVTTKLFELPRNLVMPLRTIFLRLMLWSLGLAAATGVLAVLLQGGNLIWQLVGTGITTSVACALMIPASLLVDRERVRWAGLLGMAAVIVEFLLALSLIWELAWAFNAFLSDVDFRVFLTMVFLGIAVGTAMTFAAPLRTARHVLAAKTGLGFTALAFVAYLIAIWVTSISRSIDFRWWGTANASAVLGLLTVLSLFGSSGFEPRSWRWGGIGASFVACVMWLIDIWIGSGSDLGFVIFCGLLCLSAVVAHANLCLVAVNLSSSQQWVRGGTIAAAIATALTIVLFVAKEKFPAVVPIEGDMVGRFMQAAGIIASCGTLALLVLARINRKVDVEPGSADLGEISLVCPRCRRKQSLPVGNSICTSCGLRISIHVEEPRCAKCDYLLRGLTSDQCPECGASIASSAAIAG